jgi:hypothetical protein
MAATRLLLAFVCFAITGSYGQFNSHLLTPSGDQRQQLVHIAASQAGVREATGNNDGIAVSHYLAVTGLGTGHPWCAAYICWVYQQAGFAKPKSAWSPDLFPSSKITAAYLPGNLLGIYFPELKRIAHVGLIVKRDGDYLISYEGNTNIAGSREGDGVYLKRRHIRTIYRMADWVKEGGIKQ